MSGAPQEPLVFLYRLKPGMGPEYDRAHRDLWPEMSALLDEAGIHDYRIWRREETVICHMRTHHGFDHANATTNASAVQARWTASLQHLFAEIADTSGAPLWLNPVFTHRPADGYMT